MIDSLDLHHGECLHHYYNEDDFTELWKTELFQNPLSVCINKSLRIWAL